MSFFSKAISRYYETNNWQLIFSNGMNLSLLSLEMEEKLSYTFGASQCSRILRGLQIPTQKEIDTLCGIVGIPLNDREQLYRAAAKDCLHKHSLYTHIIHKKHRYTKFLEHVLQSNPIMLSIDNLGVYTDLNFSLHIISLIASNRASKAVGDPDVMTGILQNPSTEHEQWYVLQHA